jgi:hypothetical protein
LLHRAGHAEILVVLAGGLFFIASAEKFPDYHVTQDPAHVIYANSAFAHGNRHGYEEGFHAGDGDYHLRHAPAPSKPSKSHGYKREYGDKKSYMQGYVRGFHAGYADSYSGQAFRGNQEIIDFANDSPGIENQRAYTGSVAANYLQRTNFPSFDAGIAEGYKDGYSSTEATTYAPGLGAFASERCQIEHQTQTTYCTGYGIGFLLGKEDIRSVRALDEGDSGKSLQAKH